MFQTPREFSDVQKLLNYYVERIAHGHFVKKTELNLILAGDTNGVTAVQIQLNSCEAYELGQALLATADFLNEQSDWPPTKKAEDLKNES